MRILIAEDDPKLLKSLVHIFELNHYAVDGVDNGIDAFDFASSGEYDGLILDIMMPGMDGVPLLRQILFLYRGKHAKGSSHRCYRLAVPPIQKEGGTVRVNKKSA